MCPARASSSQAGRLAQHNIPETNTNIDQVKEALHNILKNEISNHIAIAEGSNLSHTTINTVSTLITPEVNLLHLPTQPSSASSESRYGKHQICQVTD